MSAPGQAPGEARLEAGRPADIKAVPVRHPGRWVAVAIIAVLAAMLVHTLVFARVSHVTGRKPDQTRFGWGFVGQYFLSRPILDGLKLTVELTVIGMAIGIVGGVLLAVMRLSANPVLSAVSWGYIWFFRGTPLLVQIFFWYQGIAYLYQPTPQTKLGIGIPFGPQFADVHVNSLITPFVAGCIGLGLNEAAYMAEIVRAGILSVDEGQAEAASSLGMSRALTMRRVVLPQAMRVIIPPTGNELISMLKNSSLVSVATVTELYYAQSLIAATNYEIVPMLLVASLWYLLVTSLLTVGQYYVERYYARGSSRALPLTPWQRLRTMVTTFHAPPPAALPVDVPVIGVTPGRQS